MADAQARRNVGESVPISALVDKFRSNFSSCRQISFQFQLQSTNLVLISTSFTKGEWQTAAASWRQIALTFEGQNLAGIYFQERPGIHFTYSAIHFLLLCTFRCIWDEISWGLVILCMRMLENVPRQRNFYDEFKRKIFFLRFSTFHKKVSQLELWGCESGTLNLNDWTEINLL